MHSFKFLNANKHHFSILTGSFKLKKKQDKYGLLIKILGYPDKENLPQFFTRHIITRHPDSLFILTLPTYPDNPSHTIGHTSSFATDKTGKIAGSLSKRPDCKTILSHEQRIPDKRLPNHASILRKYPPIFTSVEQDIQKYETISRLIPTYPLYIHIIPFASQLNLELKNYQDNIHAIKSMNEGFTLRSTVDPVSGRYKPASNCNVSTEQAIFGLEHRIAVYDMYCQEATMTMVSEFVHDKTAYLKLAHTLGLLEGIEPSEIHAERYEPVFVG